MGILSFTFLKQGWKTAPWKDFVHLLTEGAAAFVKGIIFLFSAFIPHENLIKDVLNPTIIEVLPSPIQDLPFKVGFWLLGGIIIALPAYTISKIVIEHKKRSMQAKAI